MPDYGTVAGFRTYHGDRGRTVDSGTYSDADVDAAKLIASEWIDGAYWSSFPGSKVSGRDQTREWPRTGVVDKDGYAVDDATVPPEIEYATYEATLRELQSAGALSKDYTPSKYRRVAISGSVSVDYENRQVTDIQTQFKIINEILAPILSRYASLSSLSGSTGRA